MKNTVRIFGFIIVLHDARALKHVSNVHTCSFVRLKLSNSSLEYIVAEKIMLSEDCYNAISFTTCLLVHTGWDNWF